VTFSDEPACVERKSWIVPLTRGGSRKKTKAQHCAGPSPQKEDQSIEPDSFDEHHRPHPGITARLEPIKIDTAAQM
jgi:hypothetical protein